jgi:hypothetical protein
MTVRAASGRQRRDRADEGEIVADNIVFWEAWMMAGEVRVRGCDGDGSEVGELQRWCGEVGDTRRRHGDQTTTTMPAIFMRAIFFTSNTRRCIHPLFCCDNFPPHLPLFCFIFCLGATVPKLAVVSNSKSLSKNH